MNTSTHIETSRFYSHAKDYVISIENKTQYLPKFFDFFDRKSNKQNLFSALNILKTFTLDAALLHYQNTANISTNMFGEFLKKLI